MKKFLHRVLPFVFVIALCLSATVPAAAAALCADADGDGEITLQDVFCVLAEPRAKSDPAGATAAGQSARRDQARAALARGYDYVVVSNDTSILASGGQAIVNALKAPVAERVAR